MAELPNTPILPTNERMTFRVPSFTKPGVTYRVDLLAHRGAGECECEDWRYNRQTAVLSGQPHGTRLTMCRHVRDARRDFLNGLLERMARDETSPGNTRQPPG